MSIEIDSFFKNKSLNKYKILDYGFKNAGDDFIKEIPIMDKQFNAVILIHPDGSSELKVIDNKTKEDYIPAYVKNTQGSFVGKVKEICQNILIDISDKCFDCDTFKSKQAKRIIDFIKSSYCVEPEFLWKRYPEYAAFRRDDNNKWFAVIMNIDKSKLGISEHENVEIIDLKSEPEYIEELLKKEGFYPAYHMNKKHWFTICLDDGIPDDIIFSLISSSFKCTGSK
ncbi:MAG: MmcQ/YjbR family DNA-binding protein [Anaerovoracaceae bacterium]